MSNSNVKIEQIRDFLQKYLVIKLPFPVKVTIEDDALIFCMKIANKEVKAVCKNTEDLITLLNGSGPQAEAALDKICETLNMAVKAAQNVPVTGDVSYNSIQDKLILRPLNFDNNKKDLVNVPYIRVGPIALVLYAVITHLESDYCTTKIPRSMIQSWNKPEKELLKEALVNTSRLYPPVMFSLDDLLTAPVESFPEKIFRFPVTTDMTVFDKDKKNYVLTNSLEINGTIAVFYPDVLHKISTYLDSDLYIAFTSIHEAQIHPVQALTPLLIQNSLLLTNHECNSEQEILSNSVYRYDRKDQCLYQWSSDRFVKIFKLPRQADLQEFHISDGIA